MKTTKLFSFCALALGLMALSCQKTEIGGTEVPEIGDEVIIFVAESPAITTKAEFGTLTEGAFPILWSTEDQFKVAYTFLNASETVQQSGTVTSASPATVSADGRSITFSANFSANPARLAPYTYVATYPAAKSNTTYIKDGIAKVRVPATQSPLATGPDKDAIGLTAVAVIPGDFPGNANNVDFGSFHHTAAYGCIKFSSLPSFAEGEAPATLSLSASGKLLHGISAYDIATGVAGQYDDTTQGNEITLDLTASEGVSLSTGVYFSVLPFTLSGGDALKVVLTTTAGKIYSKTLTIKEEASLPFVVGQVSSFSVKFADALSPIEIASASAWNALCADILANVGDDKGASYTQKMIVKITDNFTLAGTDSNLGDAITFAGTLDGNGKTITVDEYNKTLINKTTADAVIKNLTLQGTRTGSEAVTYAANFVHELAGAIEGCTSRVNCTMSNDFRQACGLVRNMKKGSSMKNCDNYGSYTATSMSDVAPIVGGLAISTSTLVENCHNHGDISITLSISASQEVKGIGGLAVNAEYDSTPTNFKNCSNEGDITIDVTLGGAVALRRLGVGGIVATASLGAYDAGGVNSGKFTALTKCTNSGNITLWQRGDYKTNQPVAVGGLIGYAANSEGGSATDRYFVLSEAKGVYFQMDADCANTGNLDVCVPSSSTSTSGARGNYIGGLIGLATGTNNANLSMVKGSCGTETTPVVIKCGSFSSWDSVGGIAGGTYKAAPENNTCYVKYEFTSCPSSTKTLGFIGAITGYSMEGSKIRNAKAVMTYDITGATSRKALGLFNVADGKTNYVTNLDYSGTENGTAITLLKEVNGYKGSFKVAKGNKVTVNGTVVCDATSAEVHVTENNQ